MKCPKCGSENVTIELVQAQSKTKKHGTGDFLFNAPGISTILT